MSSETITRTDLANILNEIGIGAIPYGTNRTFDIKDTEATAITVSNTTPQKVFSINHTSQTGQILCIGRLYLQTSTYTSRGRLFIDENNVDTVNTNATTDKEMILFYVANVAEGTHEISLRVSTQNTSCTGTIPAYRTLGLLAVDLPKEQYVGATPPEDQWEQLSITTTRTVGSGGTVVAYKCGKLLRLEFRDCYNSAQTGVAGNVWQATITGLPQHGTPYSSFATYYSSSCVIFQMGENNDGVATVNARVTGATLPANSYLGGTLLTFIT